MSKRVSYWTKKAISLMLIVVMSVPSVALGTDLRNNEELAWQQLSEIQPLDPFAIVLPEIEDEDYGERRLNDLLSRISDFHSFTAEEQFLIEEYLGTHEDLLAERDPEYLEVVLQRQFDERPRCENVLLEEAFHELLRSGLRYADLSADDRNLLYSRLFIAEEALEITSALFNQMASEGYTLAESAELVQMMSGGLLNYTDAQILLRTIPDDQERRIEIEHWERFSQLFDIADYANERRLVNHPFVSMNGFEDWDHDRYTGRFHGARDISIFLETTEREAYSFIDSARRIEGERLNLSPEAWLPDLDLWADQDTQRPGLPELELHPDWERLPESERLPEAEVQLPVSPSEDESLTNVNESLTDTDEEQANEASLSETEWHVQRKSEQENYLLSPSYEDYPLDDDGYPSKDEYPRDEEYPLEEDDEDYSGYPLNRPPVDENIPPVREPHPPLQEENQRIGIGVDQAIRTRRWNNPDLKTYECWETSRSIFSAFTSQQAFHEAQRMLLSGMRTSEIETSFALGAALQVEPSRALIEADQAIITMNGMDAMGNMNISTMRSMNMETVDMDFIGDMIMDINCSMNNIRYEIIHYGHAIIHYGFSTMTFQQSTPTHGDIIANPFNMHFNANESVTLNTGASVFRTNITSHPGRGGFGFNLDLVYDSSQADIRRATINNSATQPRHDLFGLGVGWRFDLPSIVDNVLYLPNIGSFPINGNQIVGRTLQDMVLTTNNTFVNGGLTSTRRLRFHNGIHYYFSGPHIIGMVDRFGNTIRFTWSYIQEFQNPPSANRRVLTGISDTSFETLVGIRYNVLASSRSITVTDQGGGVFTINMSPIPNHNDFRVDSIRNQVNATTTFTYTVETSRFSLSSKTPSIANHSLILRQVNYPAGGGLRFNYDRTTINLGASGSREIWRVSSREFFIGNRIYLRTNFRYYGDHTAFPQPAVPADHIHHTVVSQNNIIKTNYSFNHRHLNTSQRTYSYSPHLLLSVKTIVYNNDRLPTSIALTEHRGSLSRTTHRQFVYNQFGQITSAVSPLGEGINNPNFTTTTTYDNGFGRFGLPLVTTTRPNAQTTVREQNVPCCCGRRIVRTYVYENTVRRSRTDFLHDTYGNITEIREFPNARGSAFITTQIVYNSGTMPRVIRTTGVRDADNNLAMPGSGVVERSFTYDAMWRVRTETDPSGYITSMQYDRIGRITRIDFPDGGFVTYAYNDQQSTVTHRTVLGATYTYRYDPFGNLLTITVGGVIILTNEYDNRMRISDTRNARGIASSQHTQFRYDIFDRVTDVRRLDAQGRVLAQEITTYFDVNDTDGNSRIRTTVAGGQRDYGVAFAPTVQPMPSIHTFVQYDRFGRRNQEGTEGGLVFHYAHDWIGRVTIERTALGIDNIFTHNVFGIATVRNINGHTSQNTYDDMGRLTVSRDFMGNTQRFYYDALGRLIRQYTPFERIGTVTHYASTRYFYDRSGNLLRTSRLTSRPGAAQQWTDVAVNTFRHNRLWTSRTGGTAVGAGILTEYTYDFAGNVRTKRVGGTTNAATTTFNYDNRGRLTGVTDAMNRTESFTYDSNSLVLTRTDRNGTLFRNTHDNMGRVVREEARRGAVVAGYRIFTYAGTGALSQEAFRDNDARSAHVLLHYFDAQGRLSRQNEFEVNHGTGVRTEVASRAYHYNSANNLRWTMVTIGGIYHYLVYYQYDSAQRLHRVYENGIRQTTYVYNANNRIIRRYLYTAGTVTGTAVTVRYDMNLAGMVTQVTNSNRSTNAVISRYQKTLYMDGNIQQKTETAGGATRTITYTYDAARRLTREHHVGAGVGPGGASGTITRVYLFDNRGNRTRMTVTGAESYVVNYTQYDLNNRLLTEVRTGQGAQTTIYTYDNNGNQLTKVAGGVTETHRYNAFNRLIQVTRTGMNAEYRYRVDGLRLSKTVNGVRTTHVWVRGNIVLERNAGGAVINRFIRSRNGRLLRSHSHGWYLLNARGDVVQRVNNNAAVLRVYRYSAFGNEFNPDANNNNPFRFGGEYWDWETGTYYLRARNFNPRTGRFTQPDPFWNNRNMQSNNAAILQSGNLFMFVMHNPVRYVDPSGLMAALPRAIGGGITWGVAIIQQVREMLTSEVHEIIEDGGTFRPPPSPPSPTIISRNDWGPIQTYTLSPFTRPITSIVMHHTTGGVNETINSIDRWHRYGTAWRYNEQGRRVYTKVPWAGGIGYHFVIGFDGRIYEGRPIGSIGTHAGDRNATSIGIGIQGNFSNGSPSQAQLDSMYWLIDHVRSQIPDIAMVERHASWCPGPWFDPLIPIINENINENRPANARR